jgi:hypothetical protein
MNSEVGMRKVEKGMAQSAKCEEGRDHNKRITTERHGETRIDIVCEYLTSV